jgi:hypothetical protein
MDDGDAAGGDRAEGGRTGGRFPARESRVADELDGGAVGFLGLRLRAATESLGALAAVEVGCGATVCRRAAEDNEGAEEGAREVRLVVAGARLWRVREAAVAVVLSLDPATDGLAAGFGAGLGTGLGCSTTCIVGKGRMNMPWRSSHWKYSVPPTVPLFFPTGSSSSNPTHSPSLKSVSPTNLTQARLPPGSLTR